MKRIIFEVILALALAGAGAFGWTSWKQNQSATGQITALKAASEEASKAAADKAATVKAAEEEMTALRAEMAPLEGQAQQLAAVKAAMANGTTLTDLEAAYKSQKKLSAERQAGLGAVLDALPRNSHLRELEISHNRVPAGFMRARLLPAVRANASLRTLLVSTHLEQADDAAAAQEALRIVAAR